MEQKMKKVGMMMSVLMGVTLSFCLSLIGNLTSGHFTPIGFIISFVASTIISLIIGFIVPMRKISQGITKNMKPGIGSKCVDALVSDLIYTPIITLAMVFLAWKQATSHGSDMPFVPVFVKSLIISLAAGFVIILIVSPICMKMAFKSAGIPTDGSGRPAGGPPVDE